MWAEHRLRKMLRMQSGRYPGPKNNKVITALLLQPNYQCNQLASFLNFRLEVALEVPVNWLCSTDQSRISVPYVAGGACFLLADRVEPFCGRFNKYLKFFRVMWLVSWWAQLLEFTLLESTRTSEVEKVVLLEAPSWFHHETFSLRLVTFISFHSINWKLLSLMTTITTQIMLAVCSR